MNEQELQEGLAKGVLNGTVVDSNGRVIETGPPDASVPGNVATAPAVLSDAERAELQARQAEVLELKNRLADLDMAIADAEVMRAQTREALRAAKAGVQKRAEAFGAARGLAAGWSVDFTTGAWNRIA